MHRSEDDVSPEPWEPNAKRVAISRCSHRQPAVLLADAVNPAVAALDAPSVKME